MYTQQIRYGLCSLKTLISCTCVYRSNSLGASLSKTITLVSELSAPAHVEHKLFELLQCKRVKWDEGAGKVSLGCP